MVKYLIDETDCIIDNVDHHNETSLFKSVGYYANTEIAEYLIRAGADINRAAVTNLTPLHVAVKTNNAPAAQLLIENGADINALGGMEVEDCTPLHFAVEYAQYEILCMLLYYGADTSIRNIYGMTPFMYAAYVNADMEMQEELLKYEADVNLVDINGYSTLWLVMNYRNPLVLELLDSGANFYDENGDVNATTINLSLAYDNNAIFEKLWSMIKPKHLRHVTIDMMCMFHSNIQESDIWHERMKIILTSDKAEVLIKEHRNILDYLIPNCFKYKLKDDDAFSLVSICLMYGANVTYEHAKETFRFFGYRTTFKLILQMGVTVSYRDEDLALPYFICYVAPYPRGYENHCKLCIRMEEKQLEIKRISRYITFFFTLCASCRTFYVGNSVPSLKELSRLAVRSAITLQFDPKNTTIFYTVVNRLPIPNALKQLISYEAPID